MGEPAAKPRRSRTRPRPKARVLVAGLIGAGLLIGAYQATQSAVNAHRTNDALHHAQTCPAGTAAWEADCLQSVPATVLDAVETAGKTPVYEVDVFADGAEHDVRFPHGNPPTHSSVNGDQVTLTVWRGRIEAVAGQGVDETTDEVPAVAFRHAAAGATALLGLALIVLPLAVVLAITAPPTLSRWAAFALLATFFSGIVLVLSGMGLGSGTSPALNTAITAVLLVAAIAGAALIVDPGRRREREKAPERVRTSKRPVRTAPEKPLRTGSRTPALAPTTPRRRRSITARIRTKAAAKRREPAPKSRHSALTATAQLYLGLGTVVVTIVAAVQCIPGRAHDHAPLCPTGVISGSCRADTALTVRGIRNAGRTVVFDGPQGSPIATTLVDSGPAVDTLDAAAQPGTAVPVELWHGGIWRAEFDGRWYLSGHEPRYETAAIVVLSGVSGLFLILTRIRLRGRRGPGAPRVHAPGAGRGRLITQDAGQTLLLALAVALLETGSWWGVLLVAADLGWLVSSFFFAPSPRSDQGKP